MRHSRKNNKLYLIIAIAVCALVVLGIFVKTSLDTKHLKEQVAVAQASSSVEKDSLSVEAAKSKRRSKSESRSASRSQSLSDSRSQSRSESQSESESASASASESMSESISESESESASLEDSASEEAASDLDDDQISDDKDAAWLDFHDRVTDDTDNYRIRDADIAISWPDEDDEYELYKIYDLDQEDEFDDRDTGWYYMFEGYSVYYVSHDNDQWTIHDTDLSE